MEIYVDRLPILAAAVAGRESDLWADVRNEARGDLTAFLSVNHPECYGSHWNPLADYTNEKLDNEVMPGVNAALDRMDLPHLSRGVRFELGMIAIYAAYARRFKGLPDFFEKLLVVYQAGRLPCGWSEPFDAWPAGHFIVY